MLPRPRVLLSPSTSPKPPAAPRVHPPRRSPSLAAKAPRVETVTDNENEEDTEEQRRSANAPSHNTRSKNPNVHYIAQEEMLSCVDVAQFTLSPYTLASRRFPMEIINTVLDEEKVKLMEYRHLMKSPNYCRLYGTSYGKELVKIAQGMPGRVEGTDTIFFINKYNVPTTRCKYVTYVRIVVNYIPEKSYTYHRRLTIGENQVNYPHDCGMPTSNILIVKLLINSVVSTTGAKFITVNIKYF